MRQCKGGIVIQWWRRKLIAPGDEGEKNVEIGKGVGVRDDIPTGLEDICAI